MKRPPRSLCAASPHPASRDQPRYALEIAVVLAVKFVALFVIWSIWFASPSRKDVGAERVAERVYSSQPAASTEGAMRAAGP